MRERERESKAMNEWKNDRVKKSAQLFETNVQFEGTENIIMFDATQEKKTNMF